MFASRGSGRRAVSFSAASAARPISATIDEPAARGVTFTRYDGMDQDERGIWAAPGGDQVAWFLDPDENNLSLTQVAGSVGGRLSDR